MVESVGFFNACERDWVWDSMKSLTLTSGTLTAESEAAGETSRLLRSAARVALSMPQLETMVLWNGGKGEAFKFYYGTESGPSIGWRGTWQFAPAPIVIKNWQTVAEKYTG